MFSFSSPVTRAPVTVGITNIFIEKAKNQAMSLLVYTFTPGFKGHIYFWRFGSSLTPLNEAKNRNLPISNTELVCRGKVSRSL